uniref:Uncharacterized protein n=1 Tax=Ixodes ricinus TaxID=34613 RepID=A0A6B0V9K3_IXORI
MLRHRIVLPQLVAVHAVAAPEHDGRVDVRAGHVEADAALGRPHVLVPGEHELLFPGPAPLVLEAGRQREPLVLALELRVDAQPALLVPNLPPGIVRRLDGGVLGGLVKGHLLHEPLEGLAVEALAERLLGRQVSRVQVAVVGSPVVQVLLVLVHPHLGDPPVITSHEVPDARVREGRELAVDVPHPRAGRVHHGASALPDLEGELVLLAAPHVKAFVVATQLPEVLAADGEQTAGHHGALERLGRLGQIIGEQRQPLVVQLPVERAPRSFVLRPVRERLVVDDVDEGAHHGPVVLGDGLQERRQPVGVGLRVRVEEDEHVARRLPGTHQPGADQALALCGPHHVHVGEVLGDVVF